ncbi:MAG: hypothetical protein V7K25_25345 [Nostoc sp.]
MEFALMQCANWLTLNWQDCFDNREVEVKEDGLVTDLPSYTAKIFVEQL